MKLLCRDCHKDMKLFDEYEQDDYDIKIYRCDKCEMELVITSEKSECVIRELCFWSDYYGENIERLKDWIE